MKALLYVHLKDPTRSMGRRNGESWYIEALPLLLSICDLYQIST